ncbi:nuclear transport factor 2 family protein [Mesorhizobium sp. WSM4906]|uniref:nuclear transport factor 2 family protein n=1 Tax=Mesorhizobium sp. WSM4906 TaxID=3038546 RepID=UPI002416981F|nr:nuclear transport factor 2 family protein [Mesorhizobium sp. WSM4906]WFP79361.1 nuclear transport factor 2 family protein [Mesorhizobium sp. WSM4906]
MAEGASGQNMSEQERKIVSEQERNRALVSEGFAKWASGSGSPYDLLADGARWTITGKSLAAKTYPSKEAFLSEVIRPFNARMRDRLVPTVNRIYADGDTVIVHFDASGAASDGKPYVNSYAWILRLEEGRIVEAHAFFDSIAFDDLWRRVAPTAK